MSLFFIEYELRKQRNYETLYAELERLGGVRVLESLWCLKLTDSAKVIRDHFKAFVDADDGLCVMEVDDWATFNAKKSPKDLK